MDFNKKKKMTNGHFFSALGRLKLELGLKTDKEIQELLGIPQSTFSRSKKDPFPAEWAFKIELKYGITTRWIMTGQGPKRTTEAEGKRTQPAEAFLVEFETWAKESAESENLRWLGNQLEVYFPAFKIWRRSQKNTTDTNNTLQETKVA